MAATVVNYVLTSFEGKINPGDTQGLKVYPQATKEIDKEADKVDITVSIIKDIIDYFLSLAKKYSWVCLELMVQTGSGEKNIFMQVEHIQLSDIHHQAHAFLD